MSAPSLSSLFAIGLDVLTSVVSQKTKSILAQLGDVFSSEAESFDAEWWQHVGFISRPPKAVSGKSACQAVAIRRGDRDCVIASKDLRGQELTGNLQEGEVCVYAPGADGTAQARILLKADGSINLYTRKGNVSSGQGMIISVLPDSDRIMLVNSKGYGIIIDSDGVKITASGAGLTLNGSGSISLAGSGEMRLDGSTIALGLGTALGLVVDPTAGFAPAKKVRIE